MFDNFCDGDFLMANVETSPSCASVTSQASVQGNGGLYGGTVWTGSDVNSSPDLLSTYTSTPFTDGGFANNISYTNNNNHYSQWLQGTNLNWFDSDDNPFTFPENAIIMGIQMDVWVSYNSGNSAVFGEFGLLGLPNTWNIDNGPWGSSDTDYHFTFGTGGTGGDQMWHAAQITPDMMNSVDFGWQLRATCTQEPGNGMNITVRQVALTVTYALAVTPPPPTPALGSDQSSIFNVYGLQHIPSPVETVNQNWGGLIFVFPSILSSTTNVVLPQTPTPGNTLIFIGIITDPYDEPNVYLPTGVTQLASYKGSAYGGSVIAGFRTVQNGDGKTWTFTGDTVTEGDGNIIGLVVEVVGTPSCAAYSGQTATGCPPDGTVTVESNSIVAAGIPSIFAGLSYYFESVVTSFSPSGVASTFSEGPISGGKFTGGILSGGLDGPVSWINLHNTTGASIPNFTWCIVLCTS